MGKKDKKVKKSKKTKSRSQRNVTTTPSTLSPTSQTGTQDQTSDSEKEDTTKKGSLEKMDERNEWEKMLFEYVETGRDRQEVRDLITANFSKININNKNNSNQDILTKAVEKKDMKMIRLLLRVDPDIIEIKNAFLSAIKDGDMHIVQLLLSFDDGNTKSKHGFQTKTKDDVKGTEFDNSVYGRRVTPLGMAAKYGHYEIIQVLWDRGERLPEICMPSCDCDSCKTKTRELEKIKTRLNLLKANCNPTYLIFRAGTDGSFDPVHESFELICKLDQCIDEEPEFKQDYEKIKEELEKFPTTLLGLCRDTEETKTFLSQKKGYVGADIQYPRLAYAMECDQKTLVAHPNAQYLLYMQWKTDAWIPHNPVSNVLVVFLTGLFFPFISIFLWFGLFCGSSMPAVKHFLAPRNRCIAKWASQLFFCFLLFIMNIDERADGDSEPPTIYIRWIVVLYAASHAVSLIRHFLQHPKGFFKRGWNLFDIVTLCAFSVTIAFWIISFIRESQKEFEEITERRQMESTHPVLLGECALAVSTLCAGLRLLRVLILSASVGPLQCAFTKMSRNLFTFAAFYVVAVTTYALGTQILFRPYKDLTKIEDNQTKYAPSSFNDIEASMETFFWSFFAGLKKEQVEIFSPEGSFMRDGEEVDFQATQSTTQLTATLIQMSFQVIVVLFLGGMLTGLFSNTQETILGDDKDTHWKFLRSREWMYHSQDTLLTPPFNLLPNGSCLLDVCSWISAVSCSKNGSKEAGCDMEQCCFMRDVESAAEKHTRRTDYPGLLRKLFQRYFQYVMWQESEESKPEKKDVETIQESVIELRKMTEELLQKLGRNSGDASTPPGSHVVIASTPKSGIEVLMNPKPVSRTDS
ncbi:Short transient receptor potential channel 5 [Orchesella cincta]|uniref:Short transient receptor potential channel 5 n=1 Tax=Orchesella cincta TaxID=48709 RepID=A0A1D2NB75_ORCCI|nr:Short transient receptor potential channel 5 [Orchesella cincta]